MALEVSVVIVPNSFVINMLIALWHCLEGFSLSHLKHPSLVRSIVFHPVPWYPLIWMWSLKYNISFCGTCGHAEVGWEITIRVNSNAGIFCLLYRKNAYLLGLTKLVLRNSIGLLCGKTLVLEGPCLAHLESPIFIFSNLWNKPFWKWCPEVAFFIFCHFFWFSAIILSNCLLLFLSQPFNIYAWYCTCSPFISYTFVWQLLLAFRLDSLSLT